MKWNRKFVMERGGKRKFSSVKTKERYQENFPRFVYVLFLIKWYSLDKFLDTFNRHFGSGYFGAAQHEWLNVQCIQTAYIYIYMQTSFLASTFFILPLKAFIDILYAWEYHHNYFSKCRQTVLESKRNRSDNTINKSYTIEKKKKRVQKKGEGDTHPSPFHHDNFERQLFQDFYLRSRGEERHDWTGTMAQWHELDGKSIKFSGFSRSKGMKGRSQARETDVGGPRFLRIPASDAIMQPGRLRGSIRAYISYCA